MSNGCYASGIGLLAFDQANSLWSYDGDWHQLSGPAPFVGDLGLAWDEVRRRLVVCAGQSFGNGPPGSIDLWEWDGIAWLHPTNSGGPPSRGAFRLVYHPVRQRVILFGGIFDDVVRNRLSTFPDLWEWDGNQWQYLSGTLPATNGVWPLVYSNLVYDGHRDRLVTVAPLQMASGVGNGPLTSTYAWDGLNWTASTPLPIRMNVTQLFHDSYRDRLVAMGTTYVVGPSQLAFYEMDQNSAWNQQVPASLPSTPSGLQSFPYPLAYDPVRHVAVGYDRTMVTWEYGTINPARALPYGSGCGAGPLTLAGSELDQPWLGGTFVATIDHVPGLAPVLPALEMTPLGGPPLQDGLAGMPGCYRYVWRPVVLPPSAAGLPRVALAIPSSPVWRGMKLTMQCLAMDPLANPVGLITSNALLITIGER